MIGKFFSSFRIIVFGYAVAILAGALLLFMPFSVRDGQAQNFGDCLFTSVSAVCVTGLVVFDTATHWSPFGQAVILLLIQIGGLGVVTVAAAIGVASGKKIGLSARDAMKNSVSAPELGGIVRLTRFIVKGTLATELAGAALLLPPFLTKFGAKGIWLAVFHSVSAFCNAGFDLMGETGRFSSLTYFAYDPIVNIVICALIITGGIGFFVWEDVVKHKFRFSAYRTQSKIAISATGILIVMPAVFFFFSEYGDLPFPERLAVSVFQSVTTRTAGFNTADFEAISGAGRALTIVLMAIGGSPGSTAGGMKTTTATILLCSVGAALKKEDEPTVFGKRIERQTAIDCSAVATMYFILTVAGAAVISRVEGIGMDRSLFETASAAGTVGLSLGLTPSLGPVARAILMALMFFGRAGGLTLIYATFGNNEKRSGKYPYDKITVG